MAPNRAETAREFRNSNPVTDALTSIGFSQYEARTYIGLIGRGPMTGYAVAKDTQVPQPKVYETLGRLVERGAVIQVSSSPARFIAVSPARMLDELEASFRQRKANAELEISRITPPGGIQTLRTFTEERSWVAIAEAAKELIGQAKDRIYVSGQTAYLEPLADVLIAADRRGRRVNVVCFGEPPLHLDNGSVIRHSSTDGMVYRSHQARHLAVAADATGGLWALALDGREWQAMWSRHDPLLAALATGYIRHDIYIQRVYHDLSDDMLALYGAGLEGLFEWHGLDGDTDHPAKPARPRETLNTRQRKPA